ncbi:MAG: hypothetical protein U5M23_00325 [Marinagarivorans sp.]|nr:hypothetical protein [Marinagarivorans sp.]
MKDYSAPAPETTFEEDLAMTLAEHAAYAAFIAGHNCRFRGPQASPELKNVPKRLEYVSRAYFGALAGTTRLSAGLSELALNVARAQRVKSLSRAE